MKDIIIKKKFKTDAFSKQIVYKVVENGIFEKDATL